MDCPLVLKSPYLICTKCALELCGTCINVDYSIEMPICHTRPSNRQVCQTCSKDYKCLNIPLLRTVGLNSEAKDLFLENIKNINISITNEDFIVFINNVSNLLSLINFCGVSEAPKNLLGVVKNLLGIAATNTCVVHDDDCKKNELEYEFIPEIIKMIEDVILLKVLYLITLFFILETA